jgi:hypothetical protein
MGEQGKKVRSMDMKNKSQGWLPAISLALIVTATVLPDLSKAALRPQGGPEPEATVAESESNNTAATADPVATGDLFNGAIGVPSDVDYVSFAVAANTHIIAQVRLGTLFDSQLAVIGTNGTTVLKFDDNAEPRFRFSQLSYIFDTAGTYYLRVTSATALTGSYTLSVQLASSGQFLNETEPNGLATPDPIVVGQPVRANITPPSDVDYFSFAAPASSRVYAYAQTEGSVLGNDDVGEDSSLALLDSGGGQIAADDDSGPGFSSLIAGALTPSAGNYLLSVNSNLSFSITPYVLFTAVYANPPTSETESNDVPAAADPGAGLNAGLIGSVGDVDYYSFTAAAGDNVFIALDNDPEQDAAIDPLDARITLFAPDGTTTLLFADFGASGPTGDEVIVFSPKSPGTHYVEVRNVNNAGGADYTYHLGINVSQGMGQTDADTVGLFTTSSALFQLRNSNSPGPADIVFAFGVGGAGYRAISGDWNNDDIDTVGIYNPATAAFFLKNTNTSGNADIVFAFGPAGAGLLPLAGDWDNDGDDTIGLYDPATSVFFLKNANASGPADSAFRFGPAGAGLRPITGDWDGDGDDTIGLYNPASGAFFLRNTNSVGPANITFTFGAAGAGFEPIAGDWNGDGADTIGLYGPTNGAFFLRNTNSAGPADLVFTYGVGGAQPIIGNWNGPGV